MTFWFDELRLKLQARRLKTLIPLDINRWRCKGLDLFDDAILYPEVAINNSWWDLLSTVWRNRGYMLYVLEDPRDIQGFIPAPIDGKPETKQRYPYARRLYEKNDQALLAWVPCIRGARDRNGRDVVIRIVSSSLNPTTELRILRHLRSSAVSKDPRNITIPIIDEQEIYGLIFIVMPRWDHAWNHDFGSVNELMDASEAFLKYLEFLHEHRIAHMDLHRDNTAINTIVSVGSSYTKGLRRPDDTHYAVFDFGASYMYPRDTPLDSVQEVRDVVGWGIEGLVEPNVPFNPFQVDVAAMGRLIASGLRIMEEDIPEIVPFVEGMYHKDPKRRPTAHGALGQFQKIRAGLTPGQVAAPVRGVYWHPVYGVTLKREYKQKKAGITVV
ncbi:hypothetical protein BJ165DRAFT_1548157 [Panaeolus papilionaceus]|nr:hypothetical protein BJ165DRAFT_1548157 [Panaeolus papilionaceus]